MSSRGGPILLVVPTLTRGGAERVFVDLAGGLARRGHEVHLAWASGPAELAPTLRPDVEGHDLACGRTATAVPRLRRLVGDLRPRAVLAAMVHGNLLAAAAVRGRTRRPALVFTEHVHLRAMGPTAALVPLGYRLADAVVAVSSGVAADLVARGRLPSGLVHHIPNPVDFERIDRLAARPAVAGSAGPGSGSNGVSCPVVVAAGRLVPVKGFDLLIRAMASLPTGIRLVVLGEGPARRQLEALARDVGVADRVALPGAAANPYPQMAEADVFVSSSRSEALPTVLIEALHLGRPVVATDCSAGVREVLHGGALGRLVPAEDVEALAGAIAATLSVGTGTSGADGVARYALDAVVSRYERLVDELTERR